jgi:putative transposase
MGSWTHQDNGMSGLSANSYRLRQGRFSQSGRIYLLTSVTQDRQPVFFDWRIGRLVAKAFRLAEDEGCASSLAWVVMPDHFHWLVELKNDSLPALMRKAKSRSYRSVSAATGDERPLWQKGYHDRAIRHEEDLKAVARYIIANPIRAGLVTRCHDYPLWDAVWL